MCTRDRTPSGVRGVRAPNWPAWLTLLVALLVGPLSVTSLHANTVPTVAFTDEYGQQWMQPADTSGLTPEAIASVCPVLGGVCDGVVGGVDLTGLTWPTMPTFETMITAAPFFVPAGDFVSSLSGVPAPWMTKIYSVFRKTALGSYVAGWLAGWPPVEVRPGRIEAPGAIFYVYDTQNRRNSGGVYSIGQVEGQPEYEGGPLGMGGWFYKALEPAQSPSPVPEPATWLYLITGVFAVGLALRTRPRPGTVRS